MRTSRQELVRRVPPARRPPEQPPPERRMAEAASFAGGKRSREAKPCTRRVPPARVRSHRHPRPRPRRSRFLRQAWREAADAGLALGQRRSGTLANEPPHRSRRCPYPLPPRPQTTTPPLGCRRRRQAGRGPHQRPCIGSRAHGTRAEAPKPRIQIRVCTSWRRANAGGCAWSDPPPPRDPTLLSARFLFHTEEFSHEIFSCVFMKGYENRGLDLNRGAVL